MAQKERAESIEVGKKTVSLLINGGDKETPKTCVVIGHGASGDAASGNLPSIAEALAREGLLVVRYNATGHINARIKALQGILDSQHTLLRDVDSWILAGHSMGGRTACAVARSREDVKGVVLFSFPLHPPGKQDQMRDADLTELKIPVMIIRGSKDAFSTEKPFNETMAKMQSSNLKVQNVEGGDHSLNQKSKAGQNRFTEWMAETAKFVKAVFSTDGEESAPQEKKGSTEKKRKGAEASTKASEKSPKSKTRKT